MNKLVSTLAFSAAAAAIALTAGCGHHSSPAATAAPCAQTSSAPAPAPTVTQASSFQPYVLVNQPPPLPKATSDRLKYLHVAHYQGRIYLKDADGHMYQCGRDAQGRIYPVYEDQATKQYYPLCYDRKYDRYYRVLRTQDAGYYREYVGEPDNQFYQDNDDADQFNPYTPPASAQPVIEGSYNTYNTYNYSGYASDQWPAQYDPDDYYSEPVTQINYYGGTYFHHDHNSWLWAIPVVIGAYLVLTENHDGGGWHGGGGYGGGGSNVTNVIYRNATIVNNNRRITNNYYVSPPPQAVARYNSLPFVRKPVVYAGPSPVIQQQFVRTASANRPSSGAPAGARMLNGTQAAQPIGPGAQERFASPGSPVVTAQANTHRGGQNGIRLAQTGRTASFTPAAPNRQLNPRVGLTAHPGLRNTSIAARQEPTASGHALINHVRNVAARPGSAHPHTASFRAETRPNVAGNTRQRLPAIVPQRSAPVRHSESQVVRRVSNRPTTSRPSSYVQRPRQMSRPQPLRLFSQPVRRSNQVMRAVSLPRSAPRFAAPAEQRRSVARPFAAPSHQAPRPQPAAHQAPRQQVAEHQAARPQPAPRQAPRQESPGRGARPQPSQGKHNGDNDRR